MRRLAVALGLLALLTGCAPVQPTDRERAPLCEQRGINGSTSVVLIAQAVPSARLLPCIDLFPTGWTFAGEDIRSGQARFWLDSDRAGTRAVEVTLAPACDVAGATPIQPSDEQGTSRFERVEQVRNGYRGWRAYRFEGGCITYRFAFRGPSRGAPEAEVTFALGFLTRAELAETVREVSDGRLRLDPP
jgi:hypothetical protein